MLKHSARKYLVIRNILPDLGGKGIRTPGLLIANETLYQLSYTPWETELLVQAAGCASSFEAAIDVVGLDDQKKMGSGQRVARRQSKPTVDGRL